MNIILIGMSGVGKTSFGEFLSRQFSMDLIDTDRVIEKDLDMSIEEVFQKKGEAYFRAKEKDLINELYNLDIDNTIVATGGGMVLASNIVKLKGLGPFVYLEGSPEHIGRNLSMSRDKRPLISQESFYLDIGRLMEEREKTYLALSDLRLRMDRLSFLEAGEIIKKNILS